MATLISNATGNLTGVATFAAAEAGALAAVLNRNTTTTIAAATTVTSVTFTVTNLKVIDAVLLWFKATAASPTGTIKIDLQKGGVSQASVTVNKTDLPDSTNTIPCPVLFKLTSTATGDGGANWTIVITTTGTGTVTINIASATTTNYTRALRTTTAATAAAADDLYVIGELTGAGAHTSYTVTMNSTAATAYGNGSVNSTTVSGGCIQVSNYGTLTYGNTAATNYILRVNGDLMVYQFGALNIGNTTGSAEIPRDSTAVLEFQQASATNDFGLTAQSNSTVNIAGLSRTSGKNIVKAKQSANSSTNLMQAIALVASALTAAAATTTLDPTGTSLGIGATVTTFNQLIGSTDTVANANHKYTWTGSGSVTNTTQVYTIWIKRGSGTNNRFVRLQLATATTLPATNGFYADFDLQAGTVGTCTALGNGTATSAAITAFGGGFICTIIGKISSGASAPIACIGACNASGVVSYVGDATQNFICTWPQVYTASAQPTDYTIDTDTGWLSGDVVVLASTTRTREECEVASLNGSAGASTLTFNLYPVDARSGTSPTQAEVGLLTRNVKIRSTSTTLWAYFYIEPLATVTVSWAEFYYMGANTTNKHGIETKDGATANAKSITYCSMHDMYEGFRINATGLASSNFTLSNNVLWNLTNIGVVILAGTASNWTMDSNLVLFAASGYFLGDVGGVFTNDTIAGHAVASGSGFSFPVTDGQLIGTFDGNTAHSGGGYGLFFNTTAPKGTISNTTVWRCGNNGVFFSSASHSIDITFTNLTLFGNTSNNFAAGSGEGITINGTSTFSADTTFATTTGMLFPTSNSTAYLFDISNIDFSGTTSIFAPHTTNDLSFSTCAVIRGVIRNCKFGNSPITAAQKSSWAKDSHVHFERYNQTDGDHRTEMTYGVLKTDTAIFNNLSPSMRMTPSSATFKLESAPKNKGMLAAVASGGTVSISVYTRKSVVGDGTAYNGNQPRLIQRANAALGQTADVVLDTHTVAAGSWEQLTATSSTATDDGAWEFIVDCDGTTGWVNVDDWLAA